jgi:hypothetical protein
LSKTGKEDNLAAFTLTLGAWIMERIEAAILRTILYADVFQFPLRLTEIHRFLIHDEATPLAEIEACLQASPNLNSVLHCEAGYYCLKGGQALLDKRQERENHTKLLMNSAYRYGKWFAAIPFVRMVALTGALAVRNPASLQDDFDYMLVTSAGRVWTARLFAVVVVRLVRFLGRELCPNYVLADNQLLQKRQDTFIAHEIAQMQPIYGAEIYRLMLQENAWAKAYLPNLDAYEGKSENALPVKKALEWLLGGWFGNRLEQWEYKRKQHKFAPETEREGSAAQIDQSQAKGHFKDNGHPILEQYYSRLREYGLMDEAELSEVMGNG